MSTGALFVDKKELYSAAFSRAHRIIYLTYIRPGKWREIEIVAIRLESTNKYYKIESVIII